MSDVDAGDVADGAKQIRIQLTGLHCLFNQMDFLLFISLAENIFKMWWATKFPFEIYKFDITKVNLFWFRQYVLTIVNTDFRSSSLSLYAHCFSPTSGIPRKLIYYGPLYFDITIKNFCSTWFSASFLLFTASIRSRKPAPTLVPGVLKTKWSRSWLEKE